MATVAEYLQITLVVEAGDTSISTGQGSNVIDLQAQFVA
jgi:hypothetical protein